MACPGQPPTPTPMTVKWFSRLGVREQLNALKSLYGIGFSLRTCRNDREAAGRTQVKYKSRKESSGALLGLQELKRKTD